MFSSMRVFKNRPLGLVMLLALMLPMQSFAAFSCSSGAAASVAHSHCPDSAQPHHHCGSCCTAAIAVSPTDWTPPPSSNPGIHLPAHSPLLNITLDRLDRPPRPAAR